MTFRTLASGALSKMAVAANEAGEVSYQLAIGGELLTLESLLGRPLRLSWLGDIHCCHCGRKTRKSFNQGYCYPCFSKLAQCDSCMMSPEKCHFDQGTCREPEWAEQVCFQPHYVYLANSSGLKVGITRASQLPTRWIDQGAVQGLAIAKVSSRKLAGQVEDTLRQQVADKTNWRAMLKGGVAALDLPAERDRLLQAFAEPLAELEQQHGSGSLGRLLGSESLSQSFHYPVLEYPTKVSSHNLEKTPDVEGRLMGIKGQYLIFDTGVINLRKYTSYQVQVALAE